MEILIGVLVVLCLWRLRFCKDGFFEDGLSLESTRCLRGILAVTVVLHHFYKEAGGGPAKLLFSNLGVLCVAGFLFLSGYGLQKSLEAKPGYGKIILKRQLPAILVPFLMLVPLYWGLYTLIGKPYTLAQVLESLLSDDPIVRFGWYTLCQSMLYVLYWLCCRFVHGKHMVPAVTVATLLLIWVLQMLDFAPFWYYPMVAFPMGVFWGAEEARILPQLKKRYWLWMTGCVLLFGGFFVLALMTFRTVFFWAAVGGFVLVLILLLEKWAFRNPALSFLGGLSFEIYSLHGFFMLLYRSRIVYMESDLIWGGAVLLSTIPAAWLLRRIL